MYVSQDTYLPTNLRVYYIGNGWIEVIDYGEEYGIMVPCKMKDYHTVDKKVFDCRVVNGLLSVSLGVFCQECKWRVTIGNGQMEDFK